MTLEQSLELDFSSSSAIALLTGSENGVVVLDVDTRMGGVQYFKRHLKHKIPNTGPVSRTGGSGYHYFFKYRAGLCNRAGLAGTGLDFKADNAYVIVPPSLHSSGIKYRWVRSLFTHTLPEIPDIILELLER